MVKSACREKVVELKRGPWTPEEDQKLQSYIQEHGHGSWQSLPAKAGLKRCGKSCRLRWTNYLRPDIKRGKFSLQEEQTIFRLHALVGNKWSVIAAHLPQRTDNEIKNHWNTHIKKRLNKMGIDPANHQPKDDATFSSGGCRLHSAELRHMAQWETARLEAEARSTTRDYSMIPLLPFQRQINSSSLYQLTVSGATAPPARPPCLDVLKAWQSLVSGNQLDGNCLEYSPAVGLPAGGGGEILQKRGVGNQEMVEEKEGLILDGEGGNENAQELEYFRGESGITSDIVVYEYNNNNNNNNNKSNGHGSSSSSPMAATEKWRDGDGDGVKRYDWNSLIDWVESGPFCFSTF